ncbi:MAG: hypothetical protein J0H09_00705 [Burkholderiales bacterium]|nr:hypothetical protein [Burkholderiales bacterium]
MNRHQLSELGRAHEQYQAHLDHTTRLIAAINEGRLQPRASDLFPSRFTASVRELRSMRPVRGERASRGTRQIRGDRARKAA